MSLKIEVTMSIDIDPESFDTTSQAMQHVRVALLRVAHGYGYAHISAMRGTCDCRDAQYRGGRIEQTTVGADHRLTSISVPCPHSWD